MGRVIFEFDHVGQQLRLNEARRSVPGGTDEIIRIVGPEGTRYRVAAILLVRSIVGGSPTTSTTAPAPGTPVRIRSSNRLDRILDAHHSRAPFGGLWFERSGIRMRGGLAITDVLQ